MPVPPISSVKTLHLSIFGIIFLMAVTFAIQPVFGISGSALFMKSNSTARIYADYTFRVLSNETETLNPKIFTSMTGPLSQAKGITIIASPSSFTGNTNHTRVVFTITVEGGSKGVYSLSLFFCGLSPLVVGLNESEVDPATLKEFFTATYNCPMETASTPDLNIVGYSGMVSKDMTINPNNTIYVTSTGRLEVFSPLKQYKSGIKSEDVKCEQDFQIVMKAEDSSPACVKPETAQKLIERGWAKRPTGVSGLAMPPVGLSNLTLSAKPIILGIPFYVNAVVTNHLVEPITYYGGCVSPLSVSFDSIKTTSDDMHCLAISKYTLGPGQSVPVQSDRIETVYNATGPDATANAQIKFSYEVDGKQASMFTGMEIPIQNAIMIDCSGERVLLHVSKINRTVNVTKAVALAYKSPEFLYKVRQYGNLSYNHFYNDWFSSESCHTYWNGTEVMFTENDKNSTRNIQVSEDINLTKVLKVRDFQTSPSR